MSVTIVVGKRHLLAGVFLLVFGALVGVGLTSPPSSEAATTYTRSASCAGLDFYPTDSQTPYNNDGTLRVRRGNGTATGTGIFRCDPGLPNGAVVKQVQFTALIQLGTGVSDCMLRRSGLTTATATTAQDLGTVTFPSDQFSNGVYRLTDSSITNATIDNANWGYWLECNLDGAWDWSSTQAYSGLYGADVIYTITAAKG